MELIQAISNLAMVEANRPALVDDRGSIAWQEMPDRIDRVGLGLVHAGMRRGKAVAILAGRRIEQALAMLGTIRGGGVAMPIPPSFGSETIKKIINTVRPYIIVYEAEQAEMVQDLETILEFRATICIDEPADCTIPWKQLAATPVAGAKFPDLPEDAYVLQNYGLNREGLLRAGVATLKNLWASATTAVRGLKLKDNSPCISAFANGIDTHEVLIRAVRLGGTAIYPRSLHPRDLIAMINKLEVEALTAPSAYFHLLCDWAEKTGDSLRIMRALEARGRVPAGLAQRCRNLLKQEVLSTWSCPEAFGPVLGAVPTGFGAPASPTQPYPGVQERIVTASGKEIIDYEVGELNLMGDGMAQLVCEPGHGERRIGQETDWIRTGIMARRHAIGEIQLLGTHYEVVLREGRRVYPRVTADVYETIPGVREAEALLLPRGIGMFSMVIALLADPETNLDAEGTKELLAAGLEAEEMPDRVIRIKAFPRRSDGEIDRGRLTAMVETQLKAETSEATPNQP